MHRGDVVLVHAKASWWKPNTWVSFLIRFMTTGKGERPTLYNHVAMMMTPFTLIEATAPRVKVANLRDKYGTDKYMVAVYRRVGITRHETKMLKRQAEQYYGKQYGFLKIAAHSVDFGLYWLTGRDLYFARRLCKMKRYPICSWLVAWCYCKIGHCFLTDLRYITPDDIGDECESRWSWETAPVEVDGEATTTIVVRGRVWECIYKDEGLSEPRT